MGWRKKRESVGLEIGVDDFETPDFSLLFETGSLNTTLVVLELTL